MIVHHVEVILHGHLGGSPLGDILHDLLHHVVGKVLSQKVEHKAVRGLEVEVLKVPGVDLSEEDGSGEVRDHHPGKSKDKTDHGDSDEKHPPDPENQEVLLVEDVVVEDAKVVAPVNSSSSGTNVDVA